MVVRALTHIPDILWCAGCFARGQHPFRWLMDRGEVLVPLCETCAKARCSTLPPLFETPAESVVESPREHEAGAEEGM